MLAALAWLRDRRGERSEHIQRGIGKEYRHKENRRKENRHKENRHKENRQRIRCNNNVVS